MKRNRIQVLIIDDDATQGKALLEAFKRAGYDAHWCESSVKALSLTQRQEFHCILADCMLPKMNGVDLVEEISNAAIRKPKIFLMSGIFKDKTFIKDATDRTQCLEFFVKPLDLQDIIAKVDFALAEEIPESEPPLVSLYSEGSKTDGDLVSFMEEDATIHAFHLPLLLKHLQKTHLSGELTMISSVGDISTISFYDGSVFAVRTPDKDTFFGGLAIGFGFVSPDDVLDALKNPSRKLIGMKLIESFALSPHAITVIMEEQLALRISQCITDNVVSLQWSHRNFTAPEYGLNPVRYEGLVADWIKSKVTTDWLRSFFTQWNGYRIVGEFHPSIKKVETIGELMSHPEFKAATDLPYLFHRFLQQDAHLGGKSAEDAEDYSVFEERLDRLLVDMAAKNHFEVLGVGQKAHTLEINKAFAELKGYYDPSLLPPNCPPPVMVKCTQVFARLEEAYRIIVSDLDRAQYLIQLNNKRSQAMLENEPVFRAAIYELQAGNFKEAGDKFQTLLDLKLNFRDLRSYRIWAGLKVDRRFSELTIEQVPPEERHSAPYLMAKGVQHRNKGQIDKALEAFRTAHVLDPRLSIAKSELTSLLADVKKMKGNGALLNEVTSVVENLFGKITRRGA